MPEDLTIANLPEKTSLIDTDILPVVDESVNPATTKKVTRKNLLSGIVSTKTGNYSVTNNREVVLCNATEAAIQISLPTAVGKNGFVATVKKIDVSLNKVTIIPGTAGQKIDGQTQVVIVTPYTSLDFISDNSNWWLV